MVHVFNGGSSGAALKISSKAKFCFHLVFHLIVAPGIMLVQYCGGCSVHWWLISISGDSFSTAER